MPKKKFKINTKSAQKYLWIVDWAKENKKTAILSIILLLFVSLISKFAALLYLLGAIFFLKGAKPTFLTIFLYGFIPGCIAIIINSFFIPNIENVEQARKYLSNTTWKTYTLTPNSFEGEKDMLSHDQKYHFSKDAETCYGEFKIDYRLNKGKSTEFEAGNEHSVEIDEKRYFKNKYGGDTKDFYFEIESDCIKDGKFAPWSLFLNKNGQLSYEYFYKGEKTSFDARKD